MSRYGAMYGPDLTFLGVPACDLGDPASHADADVVIVGAPFDGGTSHRPGTRCPAGFVGRWRGGHNRRMAATPVDPRRTDPRATILVTLAWYATAVVAFAAGSALFPGAVAEGCGEECTSDRDRWLLFGLYTLTPALFVALLISLLLLWLTVKRGRPRSASAAGTLSALPVLLLTTALTTLVLR
ncbi:hypothetical protein ACIBTV_15870 [Micromonospora sp. NPDC049366]|uniref:hypothetical protein n=1 Tax=Micromonospora sp. NPDC049366 TaxID=3364271 RepID=UPI00379C53DB